MARVVNEATYAAKRNAILDVAQRAVETTGYEQIEAWADELERVLGAPAGCLPRALREDLSQ